MKFIMIGSFLSGENPTIATEVLLENGCEADNITYPLNTSPCLNVIINRGACLYPEGVADIFPGYLADKEIESYVGAPILSRNNELTGIICLMDVKPITGGVLMSSLCEFLAIRIGADLELFRAAQKYRENSLMKTRSPRVADVEIYRSALINSQKCQTEYQKLTENREFGFTIIDKDFTLITANRVIANWCDVKAAEIIGHKCHRIISGRADACPDCPGLKAMAAGGSSVVITGLNNKCTRKESGAFKIRFFPFYRVGVEPIGFCMVVDELTDWQELRHRLEANQQKLAGLIEGGFHTKYLAGPCDFCTELIEAYCHERNPEDRLSPSRDIPGSTGLGVMASLLYKQNSRLLHSLKGILEGKKTTVSDQSWIMEGFPKRATFPEAVHPPTNSDVADKSIYRVLQETRKSLKTTGIQEIVFPEENRQSLKTLSQALRALMDQNKIIEQDLSGTIKFNLEKIILPDLEKLKEKLTKQQDQDLCGIIANNLIEITTPLLPPARIGILNKLSPSELRVANLIKQGHNTKEIGRILNLSPQTIATHRHNIRKKIGLVNQKENLFTVLNHS
ncbi:MAG: LuxR C-terminal-related transcriptional regulator [Desulfurivibrionaceae bacterium]